MRMKRENIKAVLLQYKNGTLTVIHITMVDNSIRYIHNRKKIKYETIPASVLSFIESERENGNYIKSDFIRKENYFEQYLYGIH